RPEFAPGSRLRTGVGAAFAPRFELIILGRLPGKVDCVVRHVEKKRTGFVLLDECDRIIRDYIGGISLLEDKPVVMPPVAVAISIRLRKIITTAARHSLEVVETVKHWICRRMLAQMPFTIQRRFIPFLAKVFRDRNLIAVALVADPFVIPTCRQWLFIVYALWISTRDQCRTGGRTG